MQARLLWPDLPVDVVVSLGCGLTPSAKRGKSVHSYVDSGRLLTHNIAGGLRGQGAIQCALHSLLDFMASVSLGTLLAFCASPAIHMWAGIVFLESACSTERVHEALATTLPLVPGIQYFRYVQVQGPLSAAGQQATNRQPTGNPMCCKR